MTYLSSWDKCKDRSPGPLQQQARVWSFKKSSYSVHGSALGVGVLAHPTSPWLVTWERHVQSSAEALSVVNV